MRIGGKPTSLFDLYSYLYVFIASLEGGIIQYTMKISFLDTGTIQIQYIVVNSLVLQKSVLMLV